MVEDLLDATEDSRVLLLAADELGHGPDGQDLERLCGKDAGDPQGRLSLQFGDQLGKGLVVVRGLPAGSRALRCRRPLLVELLRGPVIGSDP